MIRKSFLTVLLVAIGIFAGSVAFAVDVNPGGLGDALIYGYYNADAGFNFLRVVNTSDQTGIAAKVRFREGRNSNEVLDFFICLSAGDQWTAFVTDAVNPSGTAQLIWWDNDTPTFPDPNGPADNETTNNFDPAALVSIPFAYSATGAAPIVSIADTKEGYVEIIGVSAWADTPGTSKVVKTPNACGELLDLGVNDPDFTVPALFDVPNTMTGNLYLIKGFGVYPYNATALTGFETAVIASVGLATDNAPLLSDAVDGLDDVNAALTKTLVNAVYDIEDTLAGGTDVILSFPTKRQSILTLLGNGPFNDNVSIDDDGNMVNADSDDTTVARCERVDVTIWNDEEAQTTTQECRFSPCTPAQFVIKACNEVTVFPVGTQTTASVLDSALVTPESQLDAQGFELGWIQFDLTSHEIDADGDITLPIEKASGSRQSNGVLGLPVIGFAVGSFIDGEFASMIPVTYSIEVLVP